MSRQGALGIEFFDEAFERQFLMGVGAEIRRADPGHEIAEGRIARRIRPQHEHVHEAADEVGERIVGSSRDRAADRNVGAAAEAGQKRGERRLQEHEYAAFHRGGCFDQPLVERSIDVHGHTIATVACNGRSRTILRKGDFLGKTLSGSQSRTRAAVTSDCPARRQHPTVRPDTLRNRHTGRQAAATAGLSPEPGRHRPRTNPSPRPSERSRPRQYDEPGEERRDRRRPVQKRCARNGGSLSRLKPRRHSAAIAADNSSRADGRTGQGRAHPSQDLLLRCSPVIRIDRPQAFVPERQYRPAPAPGPHDRASRASGRRAG